MDGEAFRVGGHLGSSPAPYPSNAMENPNPNQNQFMFNAKSAPLQLQLFGSAAVPAVGPAGYCNYTGNNHLSAMNQARNTSIDAGDERQLKLQMSLNNYHQQDADRLARLGNPSAVSTGLRLSYEDDEHNSSITSGSGSMSLLPTTMSFVDDLMAEMDKENKEISYYLRLQAEQIGKQIKEVNQRQLISFLANLERAVGKKLREKELEAEAMNRKSKELNEQIRQVAMEIQSLQSAALYNQSVANNLKSKLIQVVAQNTNLTREGSGDSEEEHTASSQNVNAAPSGFFQSSLLGSKSTAVGLGACRSCGGKEASVLVMPCRHLCLCVDCERNADVCPVCRFPKSGSVEINMS
ncbi:BOI-related E3 ubiquitin-protein ligase 1-like [Phragmites australis]|uniref:BOI-related E3 ubiquitin-protein ligase 1-like n=1 Tax=Phragmites australis TaxID=29695 RepID=UPI002D7A0B5E|nr:BOI-related E3 ubiquitin-protein ligase 1-like [Phragmites australis]XP_062218097.1 BOI-related E3 ubiquitin-protein ligase 1-like [Phragmites australis]